MTKLLQKYNGAFLSHSILRSNIQIAINPPRIAPIHSNSVQSFIRSQAIQHNSQQNAKFTMECNHYQPQAFLVGLRRYERLA